MAARYKESSSSSPSATRTTTTNTTNRYCSICLSSELGEPGEPGEPGERGEPGESGKSAEEGHSNNYNHNQWYMLDCGHFYHTRCIVQWLAHKGTCPECRGNIAHSDSRNSGSGGDSDSRSGVDIRNGGGAEVVSMPIGNTAAGALREHAQHMDAYLRARQNYVSRRNRLARTHADIGRLREAVKLTRAQKDCSWREYRKMQTEARQEILARAENIQRRKEMRYHARQHRQAVNTFKRVAESFLGPEPTSPEIIINVSLNDLDITTTATSLSST